MAVDPHGVGYDEFIPEYGKTEGQLYKVVYMCEFHMDTAYMYVEGDSIANFKDGFWLNINYELTFGHDCRYWMPPTSIIRIVKERKLIH